MKRMVLLRKRWDGLAREVRMVERFATGIGVIP